jgi:hypothetical protein
MNVGDYVRTKDGINKIISNPNENKFNIDAFKKDGITLRCIRQKDVIKSSPQIIDLIEKNDYVNGNLVSFVGTDSIEVFWYKDEKQWLDKEDIKSIVTHEQMKAMQYRVEK